MQGYSSQLTIKFAIPCRLIFLHIQIIHDDMELDDAPTLAQAVTQVD
jgi:hypothetical protein